MPDHKDEALGISHMGEVMDKIIVNASRDGEDVHRRTIDNPVGSDSAFYAFVIALISIIKEENTYKNIQMFNQWVALDPSIAEHFEAICSFDFNRTNNKLLYQLQRSLRRIAPDRLPMSGASVIKAMEGITQDAFRGTYLNLDYLARAFGINVHLLANLKPLQEFNDIKGRHTVTINNDNNVYRIIDVTYALNSDGLTTEKKEEGDVPLSPSEEAQEQLPANETKDFELAERAKLAKIYKLSPRKNNNKPLRENWSTKKITCSLTAEQLEAERLAEEMEQEKLTQTEKLLELGGSETAEQATTISEHEKRQIEFLRGVATKAVISYIDYSNSIWFSLFHRHGRSGRIRAQEFLTQFLMIDHLDEATFFLVSFLSDNNNGNTYPHSFRTMLLNELLKDPKPMLQYTSEHFDELLDELSNASGVNLRLLECSL